ncbi:MAG: hypothetical protein EXS16_13095 [Gemmataceae bacterium]|nr:hypothetical protein [Gemmataceae bacterium]
MNKPVVGLLLSVLAGCSTHLCADLSDAIRPGKLGPTTVQPYGGVTMQGQLSPPPMVGLGTPMGPGAVPLPLPGSRQQPGVFQLSPPVGPGSAPFPPPLPPPAPTP